MHLPRKRASGVADLKNRSGRVDMRPNRFHSVYRHVANYDVTAPNTVIFCDSPA